MGFVSVGDHNYSSHLDGGRMKMVKRYKQEEVIHPEYQQVTWHCCTRITHLV